MKPNTIIFLMVTGREDYQAYRDIKDRVMPWWLLSEDLVFNGVRGIIVVIEYLRVVAKY